QPVRVRAVGGADDQQHVDLPAQLPHRALAVLGGVADIPDVRTDDVRETALDGGDHDPGVIHAEGGLGDVGHRRVGRQVERLHVALVLYQQHATVDLPGGAL